MASMVAKIACTNRALHADERRLGGVACKNRARKGVIMHIDEIDRRIVDELRVDGRASYADMGARARAAGLRRLYTLGPLSAAAAAAFGEGAHSFQDPASLAAALRADLRAGVRCLVKGSRGSAMGRIVAALLSTGEDTSHVA